MTPTPVNVIRLVDKLIHGPSHCLTLHSSVMGKKTSICKIVQFIYRNNEVGILQTPARVNNLRCDEEKKKTIAVILPV